MNNGEIEAAKTLSFYVMAGIRGGSCVPVPLVAPRVVIRRFRKARLERKRYWRLRQEEGKEAAIRELSFHWMAGPDGLDFLSGPQKWYIAAGMTGLSRKTRPASKCGKKNGQAVLPQNNGEPLLGARKKISPKTEALRDMLDRAGTLIVSPQEERQALIVEDDESGLGEIRRDLRAIRAGEVGTMCLADHGSGDCTPPPRELAWIES